MEHNLSLFIFHRDLRLDDNTSLIEALKNSEKVIPCFIFDERQVNKNPYKSNNCLQFMLNSLKDLNDELKKKKSKLYIFHGLTEDVVDKIIKDKKIDAIYSNKDYTPFARKRDETIKKICEKNSIDFVQLDDALINPPGSVLKDDGTPYTVYTPFLRKARQIDVKKPVKNNLSNYYTQKISNEESSKIFDKILTVNNKNILLNGGIKEAKELLKKSKSLDYYDNNRNFPRLDYTSHLSSHNKFGTISIREIYSSFKDNFQEVLINELYWRDFFTHIIYHFPNVLDGAFKNKYNKIKWDNDKKLFQKWCEGKTGFPIVDAGMRELNTTGYMHNRVRMIVASFLVKDLHINWQWGEKYFAQNLIDYDPAVNNGNWQWAASTGCDAQPYFRIFNPWSQQEKFDRDCEYIKKWVPELKD
ncbi:DNA photolyase family protein, partial [Candidatus Woesearchaeota archaeon]|nr:DNA photolyase family protein [Candidatus Woesearchaeota archaeon]